MLPQDFFNRDTVEVARDLVGKYLVRRYDGVTLAVRLTETEAYIGRMDKACHAYHYRRTPRTQTLFAPPGTAYVYLIYGLHHCLNLVTEPEGEPAAVLLRGGQVRHNGAIIAENRFGRKEEVLSSYQRRNLLNGPGKLCAALKIDRPQRPASRQRGAIRMRKAGRGRPAGVAGGSGPAARAGGAADRH